MSVFSYYSFSSTNVKDVLSFIRDKLVAKGWIIDKDDITANNKFIFHIPSTECYYKLYVYGNNFILYVGSGYDGTDLIYDMKDGRKIGLFCQRFENWSMGYLSLIGIDLFVNNKFILLFINYYYGNKNINIAVPFVFGQIETDDTLQSSYILKGETNYWSDYGKVFIDWHRSSLFYCNAIKYKNFITVDSQVNKFFPHLYVKISGTNFGEGFNSDLEDEWYNSGEINLFRYNNFPEFRGRKFFSTVPIMAEYNENSIDYYFPVGETPFYLTNYKVTDYKKIITVGTRKFMIMPASLITTENIFGSKDDFYGFAIECDNI